MKRIHIDEFLMEEKLQREQKDIEDLEEPFHIGEPFMLKRDNNDDKNQDKVSYYQQFHNKEHNDLYDDNAKYDAKKSKDSSVSLMNNFLLRGGRVPEEQSASRMFAHVIDIFQCLENISYMQHELGHILPKYHDYTKWLTEFRVPIVLTRRNATAHLTWLQQDRNLIYFPKGDFLPMPEKNRHGAFQCKGSDNNDESLWPSTSFSPAENPRNWRCPNQKYSKELHFLVDFG